MSNTKKKSQIKPAAQRYTRTNIVANWFLLAAFTLFPLLVNITFTETFPFISFYDGYIGIRHQKYYFFLIIVCLFLIAEVMLLVTRSAAQSREADPQKKGLLQSVSVTDWAMLALVLSCAVSTLFSPYIEMAFFGESTIGEYTQGRDNGLLLILVYAAVYFLLTRCFRFKEYVFTAMAITAGAIYLLAVLNGFFLDPLHMFDQFRIAEQEFFYLNFMTTIGNKNMFASFICVTLPVIITLFVRTETRWRQAVYLVCAALGAMAAVVCDSDSVVLGMGAFAAVFLVVYARRPSRMKKYLLSLTVLLLSVKLLQLIAFFSGDNYKELGAIPFRLMTSPFTWAAVAVLAAATAALYVYDARQPGKVFSKAAPIVISAVIGVAVLCGAGAVLYFSAIDTATDLGSWERTLRFSDAWGTHRGFMWRKSLEAFGGFNFFQKLFGTGPDTFYCSFMPFFNELWDRFGDTSTDAAHNEYLNYLLNIGIVGLASYLTFVGSALIRAFKAAKREPTALVFASAVVAYLAQATVNIAVPIAAPLFIIFVSLCEATARQAKTSE